MRKWLVLPFLLLGLVMALGGAVAAAYHLRARQVELDQQLGQAWQRLGWGLRTATAKLRLRDDPALDPKLLARVVGDTALEARLGLVGNRIDSVCRARASAQNPMDSLREAVRRDREQLGLAVARYRDMRQSWLGQWVLRGFPQR